MSARPKRTIKGPGAAAPLDWLLLLVLVAIGGSSFGFIKTAVETVPPPVIAAARLWIAFGLLYIVMRRAGRRFPPLFISTQSGPRLHLSWAYMAAVGLIGYALPFSLYPWAQQYVESGLAGVYMAFMPLWTLGLAYFFANEPLTPGKLAGFGLGFIGVLVLMGPSALEGAADANLLAQAALLTATLGYAVSVIITRRARAVRPRMFAAGTVLAAAILTTPALFFIDLEVENWTFASAASVVALGLGPTGVAAMIIFVLIRRAGAGFMALGNYMTPVWAVIVGALVFGERLAPNVFIALGVILAGVAISQRRRRI